MSSVTLNEVLEVLSSRTAAGSNFGTHLERAQDGLSWNGKGLHAMQVSAIEDRMLQAGAVYRCVDDLAAAGLEVMGIGKDSYPSLSKLRMKTDRPLPPGYAVVKCLRVYQEWATREPVRGLAAVYSWMHEVAPDYCRLAEHDEDSLTQAFLVGKAKSARRMASEVYADCFLIVSNWVPKWNVNEKKGREAA